MKTQGEIEAAICEGISRFEQEYMGRGPKDIHAHLLGDLLVVSLHHDISAATGEEVVLFTLASPPGEAKRAQDCSTDSRMHHQTL